MIKYFHGGKKYEKTSSIFQCNWHNTNIGRKPCKWPDVYFFGKEPNFSVKYRVENGTPFQKQVWHLLENIAFGKTSCYGDIACSLARQMGRQKMSVQAVGKAVGANPICIIVPCNRVVGKTGKLTGYGGGIENKKQLLLLEKTEKEKFNFLSFEKTKKI